MADDLQKQSELSAFVLMPFDSAFTPIWDQLIRPALEQEGYSVTRADTVFSQQNILRDIVAGIATADLVIADLTSLNANVMYELGLAHGLRIPTVLIAQSINDLPFDLRSYRVIQYSDQFSEAPKLMEALGEVGRRRRDGAGSFGSPVLDFLGVRQAREISAQPAVGHDEEEESAPRGIFDFAAASEENSERLTALLGQITSAQTTMTARIEKRAEELSRLASVGPRMALAILKQTAENMTDFSQEIDPILPEFVDLIDQLSEDLSEYVASFTITNAQDELAARQLLDTFLTQQNVVGEAVTSVGGFRESVEELPEVAQATTLAKRRVVKTVDGLIGALEKYEAIAIRLVALLEIEIEHWASRDTTAD